MENASKALLIAAGVLIGIMVLSVGVYLFNNFSNSSSQISKKIYDNQLEQFNSQFTKYLGREDITAHEIVSVCNLARDNNRKYYGENWKSSTGQPYYISVQLEGHGSKFEQNDSYIDFLANYSLEIDDSLTENKAKKIVFKCESIDYNEKSGRISTIYFAQ